MSYAKRPKACQDFFVGINEVNGAIANAKAVHDGYDLEHVLAVRDGGDISGVLLPAGRHDDPLIPRAVVRVTVSTYAFQGSTTYTFAVDLQSSPYIASVERVAAGLWFIETRQLGEDPWADESMPVTSSSTVGIVHADWQSSFGGRTGFLVHLLTQASSGVAFTAGDFTFGLRIFAR